MGREREPSPELVGVEVVEVVEVLDPEGPGRDLEDNDSGSGERGYSGSVEWSELSEETTEVHDFLDDY